MDEALRAASRSEMRVVWDMGFALRNRGFILLRAAELRQQV